MDNEGNAFTFLWEEFHQQRWDSDSEGANQVKQYEMAQSQENYIAAVNSKAADPHHALQYSHTHHVLYGNPRWSEKPD